MHSIEMELPLGKAAQRQRVKDRLKKSGTGVAEVNGLQDHPLSTPQRWRANLGDDDDGVLALRNLIFDLCNQNGGGHGGSAIGMSAIGVALYKYVMRYNPSDSEWFDRDRFVLSNGQCRSREIKPLG